MELQAPFNQLVILFVGRDTEGYHLKFLLYGHPILMTIVLIWVLILGFSSWIVANRMQRRINDDLGKTTVAEDSSSIETWMKVDEVEQQKSPGREWAPKSSDADYLPSKRDL
jgi:hypothetical protein